MTDVPGRPDQGIQYYHNVIVGQPEFITHEVLAASVDNHIFIATRKVRVLAASYIPRVIGSDGSAVTLQLRRCQAVEEPSAGDALTTATFNLKATVETVQNATLTTTAAFLDLEVGDRLAADFTGTLTAVVGNLTVMVAPLKETTDTPA